MRRSSMISPSPILPGTCIFRRDGWDFDSWMCVYIQFSDLYIRSTSMPEIEDLPIMRSLSPHRDTITPPREPVRRYIDIDVVSVLYSVWLIILLHLHIHALNQLPVTSKSEKFNIFKSCWQKSAFCIKRGTDFHRRAINVVLVNGDL